MKVAITGTPGTGKSTISKVAANLAGFRLIDVNGFAKERGLFCKKDKKRGSWVVDVAALGKESAKLSGNVMFEGHLSHYCRPDIAIVLRLNPKELEKRLKSRGWGIEKVTENVEAEAVGVCLSDALGACKKVFEVDATGKSAETVAKEISGIISGKSRQKYAAGKVDWLESEFSQK